MEETLIGTGESGEEDPEERITHRASRSSSSDLDGVRGGEGHSEVGEEGSD